MVEGGEDSFLTLTGACSQTQAQDTVLAFKAAVRASASQDITLANRSITPWQLKPVIQNDYWSGPEVLAVPAGAEAAYSLTYRPLSMSTAEKQHEGSVFFPIPDGTGLLYKLTGLAHSPAPAGTIQCQVRHHHHPPLAVPDMASRLRQAWVSQELPLNHVLRRTLLLLSCFSKHALLLVAQHLASV